VSATAGRIRSARRAIGAARRAPTPGTSRARIAAALACCSDTERAIVALLLEERLSPRETALALGLTESRVHRVRATLLDELRRVLSGRPFRRVARSGDNAIGLRRAS